MYCKLFFMPFWLPALKRQANLRHGKGKRLCVVGLPNPLVGSRFRDYSSCIEARIRLERRQFADVVLADLEVMGGFS
jgi:hypothetical protein